jgi:DNA-directed RNA polymerase subunit RPC12/RpoP
MDYAIDGIVIPVHKKRTFKCYSCGKTMEKVNEYPIGSQYQAHRPYYMDAVTYRCTNCMAMRVELEHRTDKFGNWIKHEIIGE